MGQKLVNQGTGLANSGLDFVSAVEGTGHSHRTTNWDMDSALEGWIKAEDALPVGLGLGWGGRAKLLPRRASACRFAFLPPQGRRRKGLRAWHRAGLAERLGGPLAEAATPSVTFRDA
jgi:hypothetical protein